MLMSMFFLNVLVKKLFFPTKWWNLKKIIVLNLHISTNVLVYERWLVLKVWYMAGWEAGRLAQ